MGTSDQSNLQRTTPFWIKLFGAGAVVILLTAFTVGFIGYTQAREAVLRQAKRQVLSVVYEREAHLRTWLAERKRTSEVFATSNQVVASYLLAERGNANAPGIAKQALNYLPFQIAQGGDVLAVALLDREGRPFTSDASLEELTAILQVDVVDSALAGLTQFGPIHLNTEGVPAINLASPVRDRSGRILGASVFQFSTRATIDPILTDTTRFDLGDESFLLDRDFVMLTPSRVHEHPEPLSHQMKIPPALEAMTGHSGVMVYEGFLGDKVVGGYTYMPERNWALITELNLEDAYTPVKQFLQGTTLATLFALLGMLGIALLLTRIWTDPLQRVIDASEKVAGGDYQVHVPESRRRDEMAGLVQVFNQMVDGINRSRENLRLSQERLMQSEKMAEIGTLLASVVHEMRNPLSSIKVNLKLIERQLTGEAGQQALLENLQDDLHRLEDMLSGLLDYSRLPSTTAQTVSCGAILKEAVDEVHPDADAQNVRVDLQGDDMDAIVLQCDPAAMRLSLQNLLSNAIQASEVDQVVEVRVAKSSEVVTIEIEDQGKGMSEFVRERLFEPFFTTRDDGIGLGMSNVKKYIDHMGGRMEIESTEGEGTTVRLTFPTGEK
ncbi:sensor histidine kinase [bacterium]|nr:sensor histidine kinase [bacterium]